MTQSNAIQLSKAINIASITHMSVTDKGGHPYILHPLRVMNAVQAIDPFDYELMAIAVLHDTVEDGDVTFDYLEEQGFSDRVVDALRLLTHSPGVSYPKYIEAMRYNRDALLVKRADIDDNSKLSRLKGIKEKDIKRLNKYVEAYYQVSEYLKDFGF